MSFNELPIDLKNIVSAYAYQTRWFVAEKDLQMCEEIKKMKLSTVFCRTTMWSHFYDCYKPNPLLEFEPMVNFTGSWRDYIDWHSVEELLWRLDFRRKFVKHVKSREGWMECFRKNWLFIRGFDDFYKFLLCTRVPCFKPLYKPQGFSGLKSYRSPYLSARWILDH